MDESKATVRISIPTDSTEPMGILPPELSMLEPPPPPGEDSTQALPLQVALREAESEIRAILGDPEATVAMQAGEPLPPPAMASTQILTTQPAIEATQVLKVGEPPPEPLPATQVLPVGAPAADPLQTQVIPDSYYLKQPLPPQPAPQKRVPWWVWALGAAVLLGAGFGGTLVVLPMLRKEKPATDMATLAPAPSPAATTPSEAPAPLVIPSNLRPYYDQAEKGDAAAMRTLGVMYYYGMNVPKNTEEGLRWYHKAAEAGSAAAKKDLKAMEVK